MLFFDQIIGVLLVCSHLTPLRGLTRRANWLRLLNEGKQGRGQRLADVADLPQRLRRQCSVSPLRCGVLRGRAGPRKGSGTINGRDGGGDVQC